MKVSTPIGMQIGSALLTGFTYGVFAPWFQSSFPPYGPASSVIGPYEPPSVSGIGIIVRLAQGKSILLSVTEQLGLSCAMQASKESAWLAEPLAPPLAAGLAARARARREPEAHHDDCDATEPFHPGLHQESACAQGAQLTPICVRIHNRLEPIFLCITGHWQGPVSPRRTRSASPSRRTRCRSTPGRPRGPGRPGRRRCSPGR